MTKNSRAANIKIAENEAHNSVLLLANVYIPAIKFKLVYLDANVCNGNTLRLSISEHNGSSTIIDFFKHSHVSSDTQDGLSESTIYLA